MSFHMNHAMRAQKSTIKNAKKTLQRLLMYLKPYMILIVLGVSFSIIATILSVIGPSVLAQATNLLYDGYLQRLNSPSFQLNQSAVFSVLQWS